LKVTDRIVLEGVRQVKDGQELEEKPEYRSPEKVFEHMKYLAPLRHPVPSPRTESQ